jgi:transposase
MLFGARSETTRDVLGDALGGSGIEHGGRARGRRASRRRKGHGRNGAADYPSAERVAVAHGSLAHGARCPECGKGKVYLTPPMKLVRVVGMAPLRATVYELARLRCNLCGKVQTAESPRGVGAEKYDATAAAMIALLKYGTGLPFNRLARLEKSLGIPLAAATQWEVVKRAAALLEPAYAELVCQAAQGEVVHNDDTTMKILALGSEVREEVAAEEAELEEPRTGVFTSGIVSLSGGQRIALFMTGRQHAGENLSDVLAHRASELAAPIQMCDALSRNTSGELATIVASCIAHARRRYVEVASRFPEECRYVLETLGEVYRIDAQARERGLTAAERLCLHQTESGPLMAELERWLAVQIEARHVEPNSGLGEAIKYMQKHWQKLTLFLRVPGAPLDNNICERALKKAILHRKNALFYKTQNGARVGDLFMSLIHTAELCAVNPFDYLVVLQRHAEAAADTPANWMPWNYTAALAELTTTASGPAP